jgi:hypothetical protein
MLVTDRYLDERKQAFYTEAPEIADLMTNLLGSVEGQVLLEPSVGRGAFLSRLHGTPEHIDAIDVDEAALEHIRGTFPGYVQPIRKDFIQASLRNDPDFGRSYDGLISNPPYGLRLSYDFRRDLKNKLGKFYVRESYALFMRFGIERLKPSGRYVFLVPDTFLTSHNHQPLRDWLLAEAAPTEIILFQSKRFGSVQFGYGGMCIIAGRRSSGTRTVKWWDFRNDLTAPLGTDADLAQSDLTSSLKKSVSAGWIPPAIRASSRFGEGQTLGDIAECRTGIYTGDNERFLGFDPRRTTRKANGHPVDWAASVRSKIVDGPERQQGIQDGPNYVPIIRGGHRKLFEETSWAIRWEMDAVRYYKTDKKARFQNSQFYFRPGLAVPMVTSGRLSASLMENAVFDQGVVGIFPSDVRMIPFLACYLNSTYVSDVQKKAMNPGANNSAGYLRKLPIPEVSELVLGEANYLLQSLQKNGMDDFISLADDLLQPLLTTQNTSSPLSLPGPLFSRNAVKDRS